MTSRVSLPCTPLPSALSTKAKAVRNALHGFGRDLLSVDDPTMDLPIRQLKVCLALVRRSRSMSEIACESGLSRSAVTQVSYRLERRGLVERVFPDDDRRVRNLKLTKKGLRLMRSHEEKQLRQIAAALDHLSEGELKQLMTGLEILTRGCKAIEKKYKLVGMRTDRGTCDP